MDTIEKRQGNVPGISRVEGVRDMLTLFGRRAFEYLVISLWDQDKWVRIAAADALAELRDNRAYRYLVNLLNDADQDVRFAVAGSLGKLGDARAMEPLEGACCDENYYVRQVAKESLEMLRNKDGREEWIKLSGPLEFTS
jgi:HEAT repeat protein